MDTRGLTDRLPTRVIGAVAGASVLVTASLFGVIALTTGAAVGAVGRVPYYVLVATVVFVASLWKLDNNEVDGQTVLIATSGIAVVAGGLFALALEGFIYGVRNPGQLVGSHLVIYFLAAGLVCTGLGMWGLRHWREYTMDLAAE